MVEELIRKLTNIAPGEKVVYYTGFLDAERVNYPQSDKCRVATIAYKLYLARKVHLIQNRLSQPVRASGVIDWRFGIGDGFEYIAVGALPRKFNYFASMSGRTI